MAKASKASVSYLEKHTLRGTNWRRRIAHILIGTFMLSSAHYLVVPYDNFFGWAKNVGFLICFEIAIYLTKKARKL